jgi:hypothetical protein
MLHTAGDGISWVFRRCVASKGSSSPVSSEDVLVHLLIAGVDPAFDGARVHMWRNTKRVVPGLPATHAICVGALLIRIEHTFVFPKSVQERSRRGESRVLPRHHLWLGPVHVEDLRLPRFQRGEVLVKAPFRDFPLFVVVRLEVLAEFGEPAARQSFWEYSADHRAPAVADRLPHCLGNLVIPYVAVLHLGHDSAPCRNVREDAIGGSSDVILDIGVSASQRCAIGRELALERDDLVPDVDVCGRHDGGSLRPLVRPD